MNQNQFFQNYTLHWPNFIILFVFKNLLNFLVNMFSVSVLLHSVESSSLFSFFWTEDCSVIPLFFFFRSLVHSIDSPQAHVLLIFQKEQQSLDWSDIDLDVQLLFIKDLSQTYEMVYNMCKPLFYICNTLPFLHILKSSYSCTKTWFQGFFTSEVPSCVTSKISHISLTEVH